MLKRIFVVEPRGSGGMIHYAYQLCNALSEHVSEVTLITAKKYELEDFPHKFKIRKLLNLWTQHDPLSAERLRNRFNKACWIVFRNVRRVFRGIRLFLQWIKLTMILLSEQPDIVQFGAIEFPFEAFFLRYLKARGLVLTQICHEFEPRERKSNLLVMLNNHLLKHVFDSFSVIFFHSRSNQARFSELYPSIPQERFHFIPMGNAHIFPTKEGDASIRNALFKRYELEQSDSVILFFGNITPSKGVPDLLSAFEKVHAQNKQARLIIAGMPLKYIDVNSLFNMASKLGIQSITRFDARYLPIEEVGPLMELATVVVFPYISCTQSASVQAAYAFGKPVIATRVGGLPDIVVDGESGYLVEPHSPDELSTAIMKIITNPKLTKKMGLFAKELSETLFAWDPIARKIVAVYENIPAKNP